MAKQRLSPEMNILPLASTFTIIILHVDDVDVGDDDCGDDEVDLAVTDLGDDDEFSSSILFER